MFLNKIGGEEPGTAMKGAHRALTQDLVQTEQTLSQKTHKQKQHIGLKLLSAAVWAKPTCIL